MKQHKLTPTSPHQQGFTIIEMMIATAVVSMLLVMVTVIMTGIGRLYYKDISQSRVQGDVRTITDEIAQKLQLSDKPVPILSSPDGTTSYCIGNTRYTFIIGKQIGPDPATQTPHVLWRDIIPGANCFAPGNGALNNANLGISAQLYYDTDPMTGLPRYGTNGVELIAPRSRLTDFSIGGGASGVYTVKVDVAFGDDDLLCSPSAPGPNTCSDPHLMNAAYFQNRDLMCKGLQANEFCGTANLTTTVLQRLR